MTPEEKRQYYKEYYQRNKNKKQEYREQNREKNRQYSKQRYENNKEQILEKQKEYRENNKEYRKEKITCECGASIRKEDLARHKKSKKHYNFINNIVKTKKAPKPIEKVVCSCGIVVGKNYIKQHPDKHTHKHEYITKKDYLTGEIIYIPIDSKFPKAYYGF